MATALIILAAGQGTRMKSDRPKVLHEIGSAPMIAHAMASGAALGPERTVVVVGHGAAEVAEAVRTYDPDALIAEQREQKGTGHAVLQAQAALKGFKGDVVVLYGDTPFVEPKTLEAMAKARKNGAGIVVLGFDAKDPGRYGRLVVSGDQLKRIVEYKDANEAERAIRLCNSGVLMADRDLLFELLDRVVPNNKSGEFYLTDVVGLATRRGKFAKVVRCHESETQGINTRADLANAEAAFQETRRAAALEDGVTLDAPQSVFFAMDTVIGRDAVIGPNVVFGPGVTIESGAQIRAFSHIEGAHVSRGAVVGPFARLRPGAELGNDARVGNFVEIKNAVVEEGAKISHLSYIGDAHVGTNANIGAGTITCNYDGVMKHRTDIGARAFIGSNTLLVAPVTVGQEAMTASGTVVTKDVPDGALAIARTSQDNKPGLARKLFEKFKHAKAKLQKEAG